MAKNRGRSSATYFTMYNMCLHKTALLLIVLLTFLQTTSATVQSLTIIDATLDKELGPLRPDTVFLRSQLPQSVSLRANVDNGDDTRKVEFRVNGIWQRTETAAPYAINGDKFGNYYDWSVPIGITHVSVIQYMKSGRSEPMFQLSFTVKNDEDTRITKSPTPTTHVDSASSLVKVNFGSRTTVGEFVGDDGSFLTNGTEAFSLIEESIFASHRWASSFKLTIPLAPGLYDVSLFFSENYIPNCKAGNRVFHVTLNDGRELLDLDVYKEAGCEKPLKKVFKNVKVTTKLIVSLSGKVENAFISAMSIVPARPAPVSPTPSYTNTMGSDIKGAMKVNFGSASGVDGFVGDDGSFLTVGTEVAFGAGDGIFASHRWATSFKLNIPIATGLYDVSLAFNENYKPNCVVGKRVFDVFITGGQKLSDLDVYKEAGCERPLIKMFKKVKVMDQLTVSFSAKIENAFISGLALIPVADLDPIPTPVVPSTSPTPSVNTGAGKAMKVNLGSSKSFDNFVGDEGSYVMGTSQTFQASGEGIYASHRWGSSFTVKIPLSTGFYDVRLHFNENFEDNCEVGKRVFNATLAGGSTLHNLDVYWEAGCNKPLIKFFSSVSAVDSITISLQALVQNAFISGVEVMPTVAGPIPSTAASVSPTKTSESVDELSVRVNFGGSEEVDGFKGDDGLYVIGGTETSGFSAISIYDTHRWAKEFRLNIPVASGVYDVVLFFKETYSPNCEEGKRVFSMTVGDKAPLYGLDVFKEVGCDQPLIKLFTSVTIIEALTVSFSASVENAFISGIEITSAISPTPGPAIGAGLQTLIPPPSPAGTDDKGAHAVPPVFDAPVLDYDKDGFATVLLDGSRSHTHFFDTESGLFAALKNYKWSNKGTRGVMCEGVDAQRCSYTFPLGTTMVELCVTDTEDDTSCADTTVTVVESSASGVYCYFYDLKGDTDFTVPLTMGLEVGAGASPKPLFGASTANISFPDIESFPEFPFKSNSWAERCVFFFVAPQMETYKFTVQHTGGVLLYVGEQLLLSTEASSQSRTSEGSIVIPEGLQQINLIYYKATEAAQLELSHNATTVKYMYDKATLLPIITSIIPNSSDLRGTFTKIVGLNINEDTEVLFGNQKGNGPVFDAPTQVQINAPPVAENAEVAVVLRNQAGFSNTETFSYKGGNPPSIDFKERKFQLPPDAVALNAVTNIAIGPDFRYYMPTASGKVIVAEVDYENDYNVTASCESQTLFDKKWISTKTGEAAPRWALGISFNPKDLDVVAYVSTSSLFWGPGEQNYLNDKFAWANGNVEALVPGESCMKRREFLITGLPVSNHDHGINSMVFDNNGDLHILVGGFTNQGVPGRLLGGVDENPLSAASVIAYTSKGPSFDGRITYDSSMPGSAKQISGDVAVYSSGLRNAYGIALHSNGKLYASDNGPNVGYGDRSVTCSTALPSTYHQDKIVQLKKGKYYGSPNRNRKECVFIGIDDKTPDGSNAPASLKYDPILASVSSSTNGIMEYTANTFGGRLRGNLFASKFAGRGNGQVWRMGLKSDGTLAFGPDAFSTFQSGLSISMGLRGELVMPRVQSQSIVVLEPEYPVPSTLQILAVTPFRGPGAGGKRVLITGNNMGPNATVFFGTSPCVNVTVNNEKSLKCTTPAGSGLVAVSVSVGDVTSVVAQAFWYMDV